MPNDEDDRRLGYIYELAALMVAVGAQVGAPVRAIGCALITGAKTLAEASGPRECRVIANVMRVAADALEARVLTIDLEPDPSPTSPPDPSVN